MALTEALNARFVEIDDLLRPDSDDERFSTPHGTGFAGWYSRLLSTLAVVTEGETIQYGEARFEDGNRAVFVVVTDAQVLVARVDDTTSHTGGQAATGVPRRAIRSLSVSASSRHDVTGSIATAWPGTLTLEATFEGLQEPVQVAGATYDRDTVDHVGKISKLLASLRADLKDGATSTVVAQDGA